MENRKPDMFMAHELLDRLYLITDMYNDYICEHDSYDFLSQEDRDELRNILWEQYQKVGQKIGEEFEKDLNKIREENNENGN